LVKLPKLGGSTSWTVFYCHFKAVADHNSGTVCKKATHLSSLIFMVASCQHPTQCSNWRNIERLSVVTVSRDTAEWWVSIRICSSHWAVGPLGPCRVTRGLHPEGGSYAFIVVKGEEVKQHLLMGGERLLNEAFN
jgi:hypothetical protein